MVVRKIDDGADVERGSGVGKVRLRSGLMIDFRANRNILRNLLLEKATDIRPIAVAVEGINAVTAAAVGCPRAPAFLEPDGKEGIPMAGTEAFARATGGNFHERKNADLRKIVCFLNEAIFDPEFGVTVSVLLRTIRWDVICQRRNQVKLHVFDDAVVNFDVRRGAGPVTARFGVR